MPKQIILIMTDTQRTDMLGCYGNQGMITPHLDQLSREGLKCTAAYTAQPVCGPARSALFTGLYPHSNGSWGNCMGLDSTVKTVGQRLEHGGIKTAYIGKWHLDGGDYFGYGKCPDGWDKEYWYDMRNYLDELSEEDRVRSRDQGTIYEGDGYDESFTFGHRCSNRAIDFIQKNKTEDFLLIVSYDEPHQPFICPKKYVEQYEDYEFPKYPNVYDTLENKPFHQKLWAGDSLTEDKEALTIKSPLYFGSNTYVDYEIGRVLEAYRANVPEALIIYTSDHGDHLKSHSLTNKGASMYEENIHIPFILSGQEVVDKGEAYEGLVSHIDVVPTILDYFQLPTYKMLQGRSLLPILKEKTITVNECIFSEFNRYEVDHDGFGGFQPIRCIYNGQFKLVINLLDLDELYDRENDPYEMNNLIEDERFTQIRDRLHEQLLNWMNQTRDPFRGYQWQRRSWAKEDRSLTWDITGYTRQKEEDYDEVRQLDYNTGLEMKEATRRKG